MLGGVNKLKRVFLTRRPLRRRRSRALIGRIDVEDLDPARGPVVDEEILGSTELYQHRARASFLDRRLRLLPVVVGIGPGHWCHLGGQGARIRRVRGILLLRVALGDCDR